MRIVGITVTVLICAYDTSEPKQEPSESSSTTITNDAQPITVNVPAVSNEPITIKKTPYFTITRNNH